MFISTDYLFKILNSAPESVFANKHKQHKLVLFKMVIISELELLESGDPVRQPKNDNETHLPGADSWQSMFPEVIHGEDSANNSGLESQQELRADPVTSSLDHDPVVPSTSLCSVPLISSEDLYQAEHQTRNKSATDVNQPKLGNNKKVSFNEEEEKGESATDGPGIQMMERDEDGDYNPERIPSSVFSRNDSVAQTEWSVASNESLFSIRGGTSFGRDQAVLLALESRKLREMQRTQQESSTKLDEQTPNLPSPSSVEPTDSSLVETKGDVEKEQPSEEDETKPPSAITRSISCRSDGSEGSTFSFAFPILAPGRAQSNSTKGEAYNSPQPIHSTKTHSGGENPAGTPHQPPPATKKSYLSCPSCFSFPSICSLRCCSRPCCSSCWPFRS